MNLNRLPDTGLDARATMADQVAEVAEIVDSLLKTEIQESCRNRGEYDLLRLGVAIEMRRGFAESTGSEIRERFGPRANRLADALERPYTLRSRRFNEALSARDEQAMYRAACDGELRDGEKLPTETVPVS